MTVTLKFLEDNGLADRFVVDLIRPITCPIPDLMPWGRSCRPGSEAWPASALRETVEERGYRLRHATANAARHIEGEIIKRLREMGHFV